MQECQNNPKILEALIQSGYDINTTNCYGTTALMFAAKVNSNPLIVKMLLFHSAIWDNHDDEGRNILHYAAANAKPDIYDYLLEDERRNYDFRTYYFRCDWCYLCNW